VANPVCPSLRPPRLRASASSSSRVGCVMPDLVNQGKGDVPVAQPTTRYCGVAQPKRPLRKPEKLLHDRIRT
jgi:hypothetical protein